MQVAENRKTAPRCTDLREWLEAVDRIGELRIVEGADWNLEIGGISELNYKRKPTPALLFDKIKDYEAGFRLLTAATSSPSRVAISLGLGERMTDAELLTALQGKPNEWEQTAKDYRATIVKDGPVLENVKTGKDIDITKFPVPRWHEHDGGRYIGTGSITITRDPDTGWVNAGAYRLMMYNENEISVNVIPGKHGHQHYTKWFQKEGRAPIAVSFGHQPLLSMLAGLEVPTGTSEFDYAGAILGQPIDVIKGEVTGLPIPAHSEFAIEGWITPDYLREEGPFGEWTGYYSGSEMPVPVLKIERLYYRNNPIIIGSPPSKPPHDYSYMRTVLKSAMIQDALVKAGVPGVKMVWAPECGGGRLLIIVSIQQRFCGHSRQAGFIAAQAQAAAYMNRYVIVVDEDIDPTNLEEVMWAVSTRSDPATDIDIMRKSWGSRADPLCTDHNAPYNSRAVIDACIPFERIKTFPRVAEADPAYLAQIEQKWSDLFAGRGGTPISGSSATRREDGNGKVNVTTMTDA